MSTKKSYSMDEVDSIMDSFIKESGQDLIVELRENWKKQEEEQYV